MTPDVQAARAAELDFANLRALADAGQASGCDLVGQSVGNFLDLTVPRLRDLSAAVAGGDGYAAALVARTLRRDCLRFGAARMARLAGLIEVLADAGVSEAVLAASSALHDEFAMVQVTLHQSFPRRRG